MPMPLDVYFARTFASWGDLESELKPYTNAASHSRIKQVGAVLGSPNLSWGDFDLYYGESGER